MKIERFLFWIQNKLLNYPDISFITVKMFIDKFYMCLSKKEKEKYSLQIQVIKELTSKQISLDTIISNIKIKNLEVELNKIKEQ